MPLTTFYGNQKQRLNFCWDTVTLPETKFFFAPENGGSWKIVSSGHAACFTFFRVQLAARLPGILSLERGMWKWYHPKGTIPRVPFGVDY